MFAPIVHSGLEIGGFTVGGVVYWRSAKATTQPRESWMRWGLLAGAALGAAVGSRALYMLQYAGALQGQPLAIWLGGKTIVGGLLGALFGVESAKYLMHWRQSTGDGFVVPLLAAIVIGRIGCQLSGVSDLTYGIVTTLPWGWDYGDGAARHPTSAYEILGIGVIAWIIYRPKFAGFSGDRFRAFMVGYLVLRLGLEFLKPPFGPAATGTLTPDRWDALSAIQWACIAGIVYYSRDVYRWVTQGTQRA
jgi:phosphatidylglycerol:prolipoprotein diacylglycerol transferase